MRWRVGGAVVVGWTGSNRRRRLCLYAYHVKTQNVPDGAADLEVLVVVQRALLQQLAHCVLDLFCC